jgi:hypothetical protein
VTLVPVTKAAFYEAMGPLDVEVSVRGRYTDPDYGTDFVLKRGRVLVGRTLAKGEHAHHKPDTDYFLVKP